MAKAFPPLILVIFLAPLTLFAQRQVSGKILDTTRTPLARVSVILFSHQGGDTLRTLTNNIGSFQFQGVREMSFVVRATHQGYARFERQVSATKNVVDLEPFVLTRDYESLREVVITTPPIQIKEDTVEYKADSFKVKPNAMVEDLLKKLPGVSVDKDGNVTAQGKQVTKVRVNGKDFFQGDVKTATRELSADMIDKVQVIDDYGDQANISGIKDGDPDKIINLQLKKDKNKGVFGRATAGYGTEDRYQASLNANYFNNEKQLSVFANSNNVNNSLFNIPGSGGGQTANIGGSGQGGQQGGGGNGAGGVNMGSLGTQLQGTATALQGSSAAGSDGISTTHAIGTNFRNDFAGTHKGSIYGSYSFTRRMTDGLRDVSQQNLFETGSFTNNQNTKYYNQSNNHRASVNFEYNLDSFNYIKVIPQFSYSESNNQSGTDFSYLNSKNIITSEGRNTDSTLSSTPSLNLNLLYNHRFHRRGRNLSVNANYSSSDVESDKYTLNLTNNLSLPLPVELRIKQLAEQANLSRGFNLRVNYSEPIARDRYLDLVYQYRENYSKNDKKTYDLASGDPVLSALLSNAYQNDYYEQRIGANIRTVKKKYNYTLGVSLLPVNLEGYSITKDSAYAPQKRVNIFPVARFAYNFTRTRTLNMSYSGSARQPGFSQLQPVRDISNPQYQSQGNPGLKPEQVHNLNVYYNNFNFSSGKVLFTGVNTSVIRNQIVSNSIPLGNAGSTLSIPENVNGYYNLTGFYFWSRPVQNRKYVFSLNGAVNYNHNIALIDSAKNIGKNWVVSQGVVTEVNLKEWLEIDFGVRYGLNASKYTIQQQQDLNYNSWTFTSNSRVDIPGGITFRYDFQYILNNGLAASLNQNIALLNASLEKTFFKKKNGFLRLSGFDLFRQNTNITRQVTGNYITDTRTNRLTRYFMLSFTYRLNRFQGQPGNRQPGMEGQRMRFGQ